MPLYKEEIARAQKLIDEINYRMGLEQPDNRPDDFDLFADQLPNDLGTILPQTAIRRT